MIQFTTGNLLGANVEAIVNTINTVGVMGKGIALQFKKRFPENFKSYHAACRKGLVHTGRMLVFETGQALNPKYIINFPTKQHWKEKTKLEYIESGLLDLVKVVQRQKIKSIAIPPLGCGNGGQDWDIVRPLIVAALQPLDDVEVYIFEPMGAPAPSEQPVAASIPGMTLGRAALIGLMEHYLIPGYTFSLLEIQKLAYFLQVAGQPLRLKFVKHQFGPYAHNLNHALQAIDGYFIDGYGDRTQQRAAISALPGAFAKANEFLSQDAETKERLGRVRHLIEGFETPYGMELLATVHWLVTQTDAKSMDDLYQGFKLWNDRKRTRYNKKHIDKAYRHLVQQSWINEFS